MKVGITIWNDRVAPVFDVASNVYILDAAERTLEGKSISLPQAPFAKIDALIQSGVEVLVCGAISRPLLRSAQGAGLKIVPFASGSVTEILTAWSAGKLETAARTMPGCRCRQRGRGKRGTSMKGGHYQGCAERATCIQHMNPQGDTPIQK